mgnify:CR=1 FL=1
MSASPEIQLRELADHLQSVGVLLEDVQDGLQALAAESFERAQRIPLAPSTIKRKRYARVGAARFAAKQAAIDPRHRKRIKRARRATLAPLSGARILERTGGFIESLTEADSEFGVRKIQDDALKFGTKLGGLWRLHGGGYSIGKKNITRVPARLDFGFSAESLSGIYSRINSAQKLFVENAMEAAIGA